MKTDLTSFWNNRRLLNYGLYPLSWLYRAATGIRGFLVRPYRSDVPVICVGNVTVGGAGKTPLCIELAQMLIRNGMKVAFVSRGYKGRLRGPVKVERTHHFDEVGDEPLLLQAYAPVFVAKKRYLAIEAAVQDGAEVIIMDDGLQNPTVIKDMSLLVINGVSAIGNGYVLPAGPLREPLSGAARRCDAVVMIGQDITGLLRYIGDKSVFYAHIEPEIPDAIQNQRVIAFAGIGHPEKFFTTMKETPCTLVDTIGFADHYPYKEQDIEALLKQAQEKNAMLVTTQKDKVRIPVRYHPQIHVLPIRIRFDPQDEAALITLVDTKIGKRS